MFRFKSNRNRELPLILGEMAVMPKHWWEGRDFTQPLTEPPLGSGPYRIERFEFGRTLVFRRVPDWWARDLPTGKGTNNFDVLRTEYFRDATVALEAFKAGQIDFRQENIAKQWATAYDFPAVQRGLVKKEEIRHHLPTGMQGFAMNTRRPLFKDAAGAAGAGLGVRFRVGEQEPVLRLATRAPIATSATAIWHQRRCRQGDELELLEPYRDKLPPQLFTAGIQAPCDRWLRQQPRGSSRNRSALLRQAGWEVENASSRTRPGMRMSFEILLNEPAFERVALPYVQTLARLGINARVRTVDPAQYQRLMDSLRFRHDGRGLPGERQPRATSSSVFGAAPAPRPRAATTRWAFAIR